MRNFSKQSQDKLETCHPDLIRLFNKVIEVTDCTVLCGHRGEADQNEAVRTGKSKTLWPNSKHNTTPSLAVDVAPYPIDWNDKIAFAFLAGVVEGLALQMGVGIRWGGDFNRDGNFHNDSFIDMPHFELEG